MRENIGLFKAQRINSVEWVTGLLTIMWGQYHIINPNDENTAYPIKTETLCEFTGLTDKNGKMIWENDMEEKDIITITRNVVVNFIDDEDKFIKQQTIDHIIQNGKYYDVISISKARVKKIVENGLKYEQLKKENEELKSSQNKVAIEKLEELYKCFNEMNQNTEYESFIMNRKFALHKIDTMIADLKGEKDE